MSAEPHIRERRIALEGRCPMKKRSMVSVTLIAVCAVLGASGPAWAQSPPTLDAFVVTGGGGGAWSNSDNTSGGCGLFRLFVVSGSNPGGAILNPTGNWSQGLNVPL